MLFDGNKVFLAFSKQGTEAEDDIFATVGVRRSIKDVQGSSKARSVKRFKAGPIKASPAWVV